MTAELVSKTYNYKWPKDSMRNAKITFVALPPDKFIFSTCTYNTSRFPDSVDDWEFLHDLSAEVLRLIKQEAK